ncbi:monothiol glutaredoxin, putative [Babesia caballi]|uniref:Monothiol glutaredoxin, putative n=1 Tax=Babesia caballi TaxID=5871 RepID=A0AAV4LUF2_BABCB|nr:monothiol glutaredoxin, putative [Babesia caballi]
MPGLHRMATAVRRGLCARPAAAHCAASRCFALRPFSLPAARRFASLSAPVAESSFHMELVERAKQAYGNSPEVDAAMSEMLSSRRLVLFMEGSLDQPKSLCAGNLSRIFTALQITGLHTVDLLREPEILGYLCTHLLVNPCTFPFPFRREGVRNVLFKDGSPLLDYDQMLELFKRGTLLQALGVTPRPADPSVHKQFKNMLPIANY